MAQVTVKYKCGDSVIVKNKNSTEGIVTAIFIRGKGRQYEVGFTGDSGPTGAVCAECELEPCVGDKKFGFYVG